jgi:hypothetical protein
MCYNLIRVSKVGIMVKVRTKFDMIVCNGKN